MVWRVYSFAKKLFQAKMQQVSVLDIALKRCSPALEISAFDPLYNCQSYSKLVRHFHGCQPFRLPDVGKLLTQALNDPPAIFFPRLRGEEE